MSILSKSILSVVLLGLGTVFVGLICLIFLILLMSVIVKAFEKNKKEPAKAVASASGDGIANRQEFIAAVSATLATVMGKDVSGLRIKSIKKL